MATTLISPIFLRNAEDLLRRLEATTTREGLGLAAEAREFTELFDRWMTHRPDDDVRAAAISRYLDLNRRAEEHLARHPPAPASGRGAPPSSRREALPPSRPNLPRLVPDTDDD
jgi:hypothetical protein